MKALLFSPTSLMMYMSVYSIEIWMLMAEERNKGREIHFISLSLLHFEETNRYHKI